MTPDQAYQTAVECHRAGKLREAHVWYLQVLHARPDHAHAHNDLGILAHQLGKHELARDSIARALELLPEEPSFHCNAAKVLGALGEIDQAIDHCRRAIERRADYADAHNTLGNLLMRRGRIDEAAASYQRALALDPNHADAHNNLGTALRELGRFAAAIPEYERAIALRQNFAEAYNNLGVALRDLGRLDAAVNAYRRSLATRPSSPETLNNLGVAYRDKADLDTAIECHRRSLSLRQDPHTASLLIYTLYFHPEYDASRIGRELQRWEEIFARGHTAGAAPHANDRSPDRRLRVGYVSPHFYHQAEVFFVMPLLREHDHEQVEVHCYSSVVRPDELTRRLRGYADHWHDVLGVSDEKLARQIRADGIDVLVDLNMHMGRNRLLVFARKPAPVQVTWLAYPGSTGLSAMDYRLTDAHMDPPGASDPFYREQSVRLPDSWCCYDPLAESPEPGELPALRSGRVTFGALHSFCKINDPLLRRWAGALNAVGGSRLLMQAPEGDHRDRVRQVMSECGVAAERIEFVAVQPRARYLATYREIDIALDTTPYNGITTTCDALWMGVPVVTLPGATAASRAGLSLLTTAGLPGLIAADEADFVRIAAELASDQPKLVELRAGLRLKMKNSPLMDARRLARNVEAAYRQMWRRWCAA